MDSEFHKIVAQLEKMRDTSKGLCQEVALARREYFDEHKIEARKRLELLDTEGSELTKKMDELLVQAQQIAGIPDELLEALEYSAESLDREFRIERKDFTADKIPMSDDLDVQLPKSLDYIYSLIGTDWLREQRSRHNKMDTSFSSSALSLVRGIRLESEFGTVNLIV